MNNIVSIIVDYDRAPKGMTYSGYLNIPDYYYDFPTDPDIFHNLIFFLPVTLDEIVEEAIEAMKWICGYAVQCNSRYRSQCSALVNETICSYKICVIMDTIRVNNFSYFVRSISICGHSAGGQLCAMVLASTWFSNLPTDHKNMFQVTIL